ncbi:MAG: hypothetical protein ACRDYU_01580, partial [Actinomycetes bacterium]
PRQGARGVDAQAPTASELSRALSALAVSEELAALRRRAVVACVVLGVALSGGVLGTAALTGGGAHRPGWIAPAQGPEGTSDAAGEGAKIRVPATADAPDSAAGPPASGSSAGTEKSVTQAPGGLPGATARGGHARSAPAAAPVPAPSSAPQPSPDDDTSAPAPEPTQTSPGPEPAPTSPSPSPSPTDDGGFDLFDPLSPDES